MSEILRVLNKNIELKSEVVELGLVDDIEKFTKKAVDANKQILNDLQELNSIHKRMKKTESESTDTTDILQRLLDDVEISAKELGINPSSISAFKVSNKVMEVLDRNLNALSKEIKR